MKIAEATKKFQEAESQWQALLFVTYGEKAVTVRYTASAEGKPGTALRMAWEKRVAAYKAFVAAWAA